MILPNLNNLLEESFRIDKLAALLEKLSHVEIALAEVDALWTMLHTLLVNAASQLFQCLLVPIGSVLCHEKTTKGYVELRIVAI